jgi:hypothetical protein
MLVNELVNEAIDEAVDAAVFVNLVGELGPHINVAAASTQMQANEAINFASMRPLRVPKCWPTRPSTRPLIQLCSSSWGGVGATH